MILLMFRVKKIHQLTKKSGTNLLSALVPGPRKTPEKAIDYLFRYMAQLLPSNRLWLYGAQKVRAGKKSRTYPKSADPKTTPKGALTNPMRHMTEIVPGVTTDIASHENSSAN